MSRRNKEREAWRNQVNSFNYWIRRMMRLSCSAIKWEGLPEEIDTVLLERYLTESGSAIIVYDDITGKYAVGSNASVGVIDIYGYPTDRKATFLNGDSMQFDLSNSVIVYNNSDRMSDIWFFSEIANFMAQTDGAVKINLMSQRTMPIIPTSQEEQLTVENAYKDITNNIPYILVDKKGFDVEMFKGALLFDNRKSFTADLMVQTQREYWNRFLTFVGINNVNVEKRERVNVAETESNMDEIAVMRRDRINQREIACKKLKELFGLNVSVDYYSNVKTQIAGDGNLANEDMLNDVDEDQLPFWGKED